MFIKDVSVLIDYFGVVASADEATTKGILDISSMDDNIKVGDSALVGVSIVFSYPTEQLPILEINSNITINDIQYIVRDLRKSHIGEWSKAYLKEVD